MIIFVKNTTMEKTAIEWMIEQLNKEGFIGTYCIDSEIDFKRELMNEIIKQAKEMEKQQIIDAVTYGQDNYEDTTIQCKEISENYYKVTFNK